MVPRPRAAALCTGIVSISRRGGEEETRPRKARKIYFSKQGSKNRKFFLKSRVFELTCASLFLALVDFVTVLTASLFCLIYSSVNLDHFHLDEYNIEGRIGQNKGLFVIYV